MDIEFIKELTKIIKENKLFKIEFKSNIGDEVKIFSREDRHDDSHIKDNFNKQNNYLEEDDRTSHIDNNEKTDSTTSCAENNKASVQASKSIESPKEEGLEKSSFITSNMIGTFYSKPSPEEESFVKVGDKVSKGDTVCVIESMKLINELRSPYNCEILEVLVDDEDIIEFGQKLFKVREIDV